jgi:hypothetical protein
MPVQCKRIIIITQAICDVAGRAPGGGLRPMEHGARAEQRSGTPCSHAPHTHTTWGIAFRISHIA